MSSKSKGTEDITEAETAAESRKTECGINTQFITPVSSAIKSALKNPLGILSSIFFLLSAIAFAVLETVTGTVISVFSVIMLFAETAVNLKARKPRDTSGFAFLSSASFAAAVTSAASVALYYTSAELPLEALISGITPTFLKNILNSGHPFSGVLSLLAAAVLIINGMAFALLARSLKKNMPRSGFTVFAAVVSLISSLCVFYIAYAQIAHILGFHGFLINGNLFISDSAIKPYPVATVLGGIAGVLNSVRFFIMHMRIRKVKRIYKP